mgnify:CR=1 FL=1
MKELTNIILYFGSIVILILILLFINQYPTINTKNIIQAFSRI